VAHCDGLGKNFKDSMTLGKSCSICCWPNTLEILRSWELVRSLIISPCDFIEELQRTFGAVAVQFQACMHVISSYLKRTPRGLYKYFKPPFYSMQDNAFSDLFLIQYSLHPVV
jgi:hypothetical protein